MLWFHKPDHCIVFVGRLYFQLNQLTDAKNIYEQLLHSNPDNAAYYRNLEKAMDIENDKDKKLELYRLYELKFPRSTLPRRLPLNCTTGDQFLFYLRPYMENTFAKGVPPLFTDLRPLYKDSDKAQAIERLVLNMVTQLEAHSTFRAGKN